MSLRTQKLAVIYIHASGLGPEQWQAFLSSDFQGRDQQTLCLTGYGSVPFNPDMSALEQDMDLLLELLSQQSQRIHLVGHSYGGALALLGALAAEPSPVASLTLMEPVAFGLVDQIDAHTGSALAADFQWARDPQFDTPRPRNLSEWMERFVDFWSGAGTWRRRPPNKQRQLLAWGPKIASAVYHVNHTEIPSTALGRLGVPSLVLWGQRSTELSKSVSHWIANQLPNANNRSIRGADHFFPLSHPESVIPHLIAHFEGAETLPKRPGRPRF